MPHSYFQAMKLYSETTFVVVPNGKDRIVVPHTRENGIEFDRPLFGSNSVSPEFFNLLSASSFMFNTIASAVNVVEALRDEPGMTAETIAALNHFADNLNLALSCALTGPEATAAAHIEQTKRNLRK